MRRAMACRSREPANPDALPRIRPPSPDVLAAGMTFNIEPAIYIEGAGGMRHCDVVACTESEPKCHGFLV